MLQFSDNCDKPTFQRPRLTSSAYVNDSDTSFRKLSFQSEKSIHKSLKINHVLVLVITPC